MIYLYVLSINPWKTACEPLQFCFQLNRYTAKNWLLWNISYKVIFYKNQYKKHSKMRKLHTPATHRAQIEHSYLIIGESTELSNFWGEFILIHTPHDFCWRTMRHKNIACVVAHWLTYAHRYFSAALSVSTKLMCYINSNRFLKKSDGIDKITLKFG